jgi:hypothetical protein
MMAPVKFCGQHQLSSRVEGSILGERRRDGQEKGNQESGQRRQSEISRLSGFSIFVKRWRRQNVGKHPVNVAIAVYLSGLPHRLLARQTCRASLIFKSFLI